MQSRLQDDETASWVSARYMKSLEEHEKKPWLRCHERCWPDPGMEQGAMMYFGNGVRDIKVAKEGQVGVLSCGKSAVIIDMERRCVIHCVVHDSDVEAIAITPDGTRVVSISEDGTVGIWDGRNGKAVCEPLHGHDYEVKCAAVSADCSRIVSGSSEGTVRIWDGRNGEAVCEPLHGHEGRVNCVGVSADGCRIVSGSRDGTVKIWNGRNGEAVCEPLHSHDDEVICVAVSADGSRIVSGSWDGTVRTWDWNGVSFEGAVVFEGNHVYSVGDGVGARAENGQEKYWRWNVDGELLEVDLPLWHENPGRPSSAHGFTKWHVYVRGRQVFARNNEDEDAIVIGTLPSKVMYDNFGSPAFQASQDDDEDKNLLGPFMVLLKNNSVVSFSLLL